MAVPCVERSRPKAFSGGGHSRCWLLGGQDTERSRSASVHHCIWLSTKHWKAHHGLSPKILSIQKFCFPTKYVFHGRKPYPTVCLSSQTQRESMMKISLMRPNHALQRMAAIGTRLRS